MLVFFQQKKSDLFIDCIWVSNICSTTGYMRQLTSGDSSQEKCREKVRLLTTWIVP